MADNDEKINIYDYGFTSLTVDEFKKTESDNIKTLETKLSLAGEKVEKLKTVIWPLLDQLRRQPSEKVVLHWPNRVQVINDLMKRLEDIIQ